VGIDGAGVGRFVVGNQSGGASELGEHAKAKADGQAAGVTSIGKTASRVGPSRTLSDGASSELLAPRAALPLAPASSSLQEHSGLGMYGSGRLGISAERRVYEFDQIFVSMNLVDFESISGEVFFPLFIFFSSRLFVGLSGGGGFSVGG
jgi:hypothetical protein